MDPSARAGGPRPARPHAAAPGGRGPGVAAGAAAGPGTRSHGGCVGPGLQLELEFKPESRRRLSR
jgi:hypothetical protein